MKWIIHLLVGIVLVVHGLLSYTGGFNDSPTIDEIQHITAGYAHLTLHDYRINMEKPPLFKLVSAVPLLLVRPNFSTDTLLWQADQSDTFDVSNAFFFEGGNDPQEMIRLARIPFVLASMLLGLLMYVWSYKLTNRFIALVVTSMYAFSPLFLAHGNLANTDVLAGLGIVAILFTGRRMIAVPTVQSGFLFGISCGLLVLCKQSVLIAIIVVVMVFVYRAMRFIVTNKSREALHMGRVLLVSFVTASSVVYALYLFASYGYPREKSVPQIFEFARDWGIPFADVLSFWSQYPLIRPVVLWVVGLARELIHTTSLNTVYLAGEFYRGGRIDYFPLLYWYKTPIYVHVLTVLSVFGYVLLVRARKISVRLLNRSLDIFLIGLTCFLYGLVALNAQLNIGVRHIIPIIPLIFLLIGVGLWILWSRVKTRIGKRIIFLIVSVSLLMSIVVAIVEYPSYLSFYNWFAGGTENGYKIAIDSNYDWGQDYLRLGTWVKDNNVETLYVDCQPAAQVPLRYYLGSAYQKFAGSASWWSETTPIQSLSELSLGDLLAVCVSSLYSALYATDGVSGEFIQSYPELIDKAPDFRVGKSIFMYRM